MAADTLVTGSKLTAIANAIRTKGGTQAQLTLDQMPQAVAAIPAGSGINPTSLARAFQYGDEIDFSGVDVSNLIPASQANFSAGKTDAGTGESMCYKNTHAGVVDMTPLAGYTFGDFSRAFMDVAEITSITGFNNIGFVLGSGKAMSHIFNRCKKLTSLTFGALQWVETYGILNFDSTFRDCWKLETVTLPTVTVPSGASISLGLTDTFRSCSELKSVDLTPLAAITGTWTLQDICLYDNALEAITFPTVGAISLGWSGESCIGRCNADIIFTQTTPPTLNTPKFLATSAGYANKIYVPDAAVEDWKAATNWSAYASHIYPISERVTS